MSRRKPKENPQNVLLGDLESIRKLLEDEEGEIQQKPAGAEADLDDLEVPVLEDIFDPDPDPDPAGTGPTTPALDDDLFRALLSDQWRDSANAVLREAREVIDEHQADWTPEATDTLNDILKARIDATIQGWMRGMVVTHMAELHEIMLKALSKDLRTTIDDIIEQRNESSDGK